MFIKTTQLISVVFKTFIFLLRSNLISDTTTHLYFLSQTTNFIINPKIPSHSVSGGVYLREGVGKLPRFSAHSITD